MLLHFWVKYHQFLDVKNGGNKPFIQTEIALEQFCEKYLSHFGYSGVFLHSVINT